MTRISETQLATNILAQIARNRQQVVKYSDEVSSGYKAQLPGDTAYSATIEQFKGQLTRIEGYQNRIAAATSYLNYQEGILDQVNNIMVRAKEVATQGANEPNGTVERQHISEEVFQLRDQLVGLANSTYQGKYIYSGNADNIQPYAAATLTNYTNPSSGAANSRYIFTNADGSTGTKTVQVTDDTAITLNTPGDQVFDQAIQALDRLGRALAGYDTTPSNGTPDGGGSAYTFPDDRDRQNAAIYAVIDLIDTAREEDILPERVTLAGRLHRLEDAQALLELQKNNALEVLSRLQDADIAESATSLTQAQTALEASLTVSTRVLRQSILDYI